MQVTEFQAEIGAFIDRWYDKRRYEPDELFTVVHLLEEFGELAHEYVSKKIRPERFSESKLDNAIADMLLQLFGLAIQRGLDIETLVLSTIRDDTPRVS